MIKILKQFNSENFTRLWWAQLISQFGDRVNQMALIGLMAERSPGSAMQLAKLLSFTIIPVFIIGPIAGVYVDRWDRRTTLFVCDFLRGLLVLSIPFVFLKQDSMVPIYITVFLAFCLSRFYVPAKMSIVPDLVHNEHLLMANSLLTTTGMIAFVLGCAVGGFLVDRTGARGGFICDAITFFISGILVFSMRMPGKFKNIPSKILQTGKEVMTIIRKSAIQEMKEGVRYLIGHKEIRLIMSMLFILLSAAGAIYVVIIVFVQQSFQSVTRDLGILAIFLGAGLFLGVLIYGRWGQKIPWYKTIFLCLMSGGMMLMVFAVSVYHFPRIGVAMALSTLLGLMVGPVFIAANAVTHQVCDAQMRGKVFSALEIVIHLAFLIAMFVSSYLSEHVERVWILTGVGVILILVGVVGFIRFQSDLALSKEKGHN